MKKIILLLCLISSLAIAQKKSFYYVANFPGAGIKYSGLKSGVDSAKVMLGADSTRLSVIIPYSKITFDGTMLEAGDYIYYDVLNESWFPIFGFRFERWYTDKENILYNVVYDKTEVYNKTESNSLYATTAQGAKADAALQPGTSASNIAQDATHRFTTDSEKATWNAKLSSEVDGSITNEIQTLGLSGNTLSISGTGGNTVTLPSASVTVSAPSTANAITSGTAFQPSTTGNVTLNITTKLVGALGIVGDMVVEYATTSGGTYTTYARESLGLLLAGTVYSSVSVTVPANTWIKVTLTQSGLATISATYTKVTF